MNRDYQVLAVTRDEPYTTRTGLAMVPYDLELEDAGTARLSLRESSVPPSVGDVLCGSIEETDYGRRFRKASAQTSKAVAATRREHALDRALVFAGVLATAGQLPAGFDVTALGTLAAAIAAEFTTTNEEH